LQRKHGLGVLPAAVFGKKIFNYSIVKLFSHVPDIKGIPITSAARLAS
jgi:hypothetical protein